MFAPSVVLTVTVEERDDRHDEVHLHVGGQGFWIARLMAELGVEVVLVGPFGGETGAVLRALVAESGVALRASTTGAGNGVYVHDRRSGERRVVADTPPGPLSRHEIDELYGAVLVEAARTDVCVFAGPGVAPVLPADVFERLAHDLRSAGVMTVADLSGVEQQSALRGGVGLLKVSTEELTRDGWADSDSDAAVIDALHRIVGAGAGSVVVTGAARGAVAVAGTELLSVQAPTLLPVDERGAGDSFTAGVAAGLARGGALPDALRLGAAAGALNVTRHGLGSGTRRDIERFTSEVSVRAMDIERS